ncbi:MAG TPA: 4Fe-4S dicluster domain-containing protein [Myxococcota bacterium]|nr:4Fe-4S dicluster domain-containing protein [Myxococcota bacterium]
MSPSRRDFIKGVAAGGLAAGVARAGANKRFDGYPGRYGLLHDSTLCVGCRSCEFACNEVNDLPPPTAPIGDQKIFDKPRGPTDKRYTVVNRYREAQGNKPAVYRKHQCMHCNEPCCASVCFVNAFTKTPEGPVLYDPNVCVGCRYCVFACPYYALAYEYDDPATPRVVRCTMCYPLIKKGRNPACADACPTGAVLFGKRKELIKVARERIRKHPERYVDYVFGEHDYAGTSWLTLVGLPLEQVGLPAELPYEPLPNLTTHFLSLAPIVAAIFPGLLAGFYAFSKRREAVSEQKHRTQLDGERARALAELEQKLLEAARLAERDKQRAVARAQRLAPPAEKKEDS